MSLTCISPKSFHTGLFNLPPCVKRTYPSLLSPGFKARQLASHLRRTRAATIIQKHQRSFSLRREFQRQRQAAIAIQAAARGMAARKRAQELREQQAAVKIQVRAGNLVEQLGGHLWFLSLQTAVSLACHASAALPRDLPPVPPLFQSTWRRHCQQREFSAARHGAVVLQSAWRARTARLELKQLKFVSQ